MSIPEARALLVRLERDVAERVVDERDARAALAAATGLCAAGVRTGVVVDADGLAAAQDLLARAVRSQLPLVVRAACGAGHGGCHAVADSGAALLFARDPQEAADLGVIARHLAESALLPVVVAMDADGAGAEAEGVVPRRLDRRALRNCLGLPNDQVTSPTPAQEIVFGKRRRRVPRWFDLERPVLLGAARDAVADGAGVAARRVFLLDAVPELLAAAVDAVEAETGIERGPVSSRGLQRARVVVLAQGSALAVAEAVAEAEPKQRIGVVGIRCLRPFPAGRVAELLRGRDAVVVLERTDAPLAGDPPLLREVRAALDRARENGRFGAATHPGMPALREKDLPRLCSARHGLGGGALAAADLAALCEALRSGGPAEVYLGIDFAPSTTAYPKRQVLAEAIGRSHPRLKDLGLQAMTPRATAAADAEAPPPALPAGFLARTDTSYDNLARFWGQVGVLYRDGAGEQLTPDPYLANDTVPALSSAFRQLGDRASLPQLDSEKCTGCGQCWTACPDGAVGAVAVSADALLEAGIAGAKAAGVPADALRMVASKLAQRTVAVLRAGDGPATAGAALQSALGELLDKMKAPAERREALDAALSGVVACLGEVPMTVTEPLFTQLEAEGPGKGQLLSLAIDPDACKGCGLCIAVCEPEALTQTERDDAGTAAARALWRAFEALPDTAGETIARLVALPEPGHAASLSLSRHCRQAMAGRDDAEPGSGAKIALRQVLAAVEAHLQPRLRRHLVEIAELQEAYGTRIRETLATGLPSGDLDALAEGLSALGRRDVELSVLAQRMDEVRDSEHVDAGALGRLVETGRELAELRRRIEQGATGLGRARVGLLLAGTAGSEVRFPWNPFAAPVMVDGDGGAGLARGLVEGQLAAVIADLQMLRRARLQLERPLEAARVAVHARSLRWHELSDDERGLCPPLLLLGATDALAGAALGELTALLHSGLPVTVMALAGPEPLVGAVDLGLLALAQRQAVVVQSSVARPDHLVQGALMALRSAGPALLHVHAPSPARHGFATEQTLERAEVAIATRTFPLFRYDPSRPGVFGARLDLDGNPDPLEDGAGTLADWAAGEERFASELRPLAESDGQPTPFADYLALEPSARAAATPYVEHAGERLVPMPALVAAASRQRETWRTLQELAGLRTPFTQQVRADAEADVATEREADLAAQRSESQQRIGQLRGEVEEDLLHRLQGRLLELAERGRR